MIPMQHTFLVMTRTHERFFAHRVVAVPPSGVLIQPHNHGTAPAIAFSVTRLHQSDPEGFVAFLPSDHHIPDDEASAPHIELPFAEAESHREPLILLPIQPAAPNPAHARIPSCSPFPV